MTHNSLVYLKTKIQYLISSNEVLYFASFYLHILYVALLDKFLKEQCKLGAAVDAELAVKCRAVSVGGWVSNLEHGGSLTQGVATQQ